MKLWVKTKFNLNEIATSKSTQRVMKITWRIPYDRFKTINIYI